MIGNMLYDILDVNILKTFFCHAPPPPSPLILYYTTTRFAEVIGGEHDFRQPPNRKFWGPPRPDYTILYDDAFRAKVIGGGLELIGEIAEKRHMYQGCP